jgi:hypothetical protein
MLSIGKKFMYRNNEASDDSSSDDDDREAIIDEDEEEDNHIVFAATPPLGDDEEVAAPKKKTTKRMSATKRKYQDSLHEFGLSYGAIPDDEKASALQDFVERHPPAKRRRTENAKPKVYSGYHMFLKMNMANAPKDIESKQRMAYCSKKWDLTDKEEKTRYQTLADEENLRLDPNYKPTVPKQKRATSNPMLVWVKERLSKMPEHENKTKKELHKIAMEELKKPEIVEEYKRN